MSKVITGRCGIPIPVWATSLRGESHHDADRETRCLQYHELCKQYDLQEAVIS